MTQMVPAMVSPSYKNS